jgi:hypothetical protein
MERSFAMDLTRTFQRGASMRDLARETGIPVTRIEARIRAILTLLLEQHNTRASGCALRLSARLR